MSPNNFIIMKNSKAKCSLLIVLFMSILIAWHAHVGLANVYTGEGYCPDAVCIYSRAIDTERVTDWHSSLCMYEAIFLKKLCIALFDWNISSFQVMGIFFYGAIICLIVNICYWICLCVNKYKGGLFATLLFSLAYIELDKRAAFSLDFSFISVLSMYITTLMLYTKVSIKWKKYLLLIGLFILLVHMAAIRRNAIVLVPFLVYPLINYEWKDKFKLFYRFAVILLFSCAVYFSSNTLLSSFLPVKKSYPTCVMLSSEMRMASILRGEVDSSDNPYIKDVYRNQYTLIQDSSCSGGKLVLSQYYDIPDAFSRDETLLWNSIKNRYIHEWINHPQDMIVVRIIQSVQLLYGAQTPDFIKEWVCMLYPEVRKNPDAWSFREGRAWSTTHMAIVRLLIVCIGGLIACILWRKGRNKLEQKDYVYIFSQMCGMSGVLYLMSFLIVTPSPDARYIMPAVSLALCSIAPLAEKIMSYMHTIIRNRICRYT